MNFVLKSTCIAVLALLSRNMAQAQHSEAAWNCSYVKGHNSAARTTIGSPAEDNYDIKHLKFNLNMTNDTTFISGDVTTSAMVSGPSMPTYVFELDSALVVDSAFVNGISHPVTRKGSVRTITLPVALTTGTMFTAQIFYHGAPVPYAGTNGINSLPTGYGSRVTFTHSEVFNAKEWWPSKLSLTDKIDSVDMWVTVADSLKAGSNGLLQAITPIDAHHVRYEWKERYPIDHYLISVAVSTYTDYSYYMHFTGSTDSMLVQNYIYSDPSYVAAHKTEIDSTGLMVDYFSALYGRYPFWKEKYGHCAANLGGAMEHQTMTTTGYFDPWIIAHELGHQWFGDNVTCGTWADIFVNEGVASYTEDLFYEHFHSPTQMINDIKIKQLDVMKLPTGTIYGDDTTNQNRILNGRLSYDKGACMLHMLRFVINNDSAFFQVFKDYQHHFAGGTGTIIDFRNTATNLLGTVVNGINLDTFFSQWAFEQGYPKHYVKWNQKGTDVYIQLDQTTANPASVSLFTLPVAIKLHSATGDTTVRILNDKTSQLYHFNWSKTMSSLAYDPNSWLVDSVQSIIHDVTLDLQQPVTPAITIAPNPTHQSWTVTNLAINSTLTVSDISGRVLWNKTTDEAGAVIPAEQLATGLYLLKISSSEGWSTTFKLLKQ